MKTQEAGFLNKEAQATEGILKWKRGLETQNHQEQNGKFVLAKISEDPTCRRQHLKQPGATQIYRRARAGMHSIKPVPQERSGPSYSSASLPYSATTCIYFMTSDLAPLLSEM